VMVRSGRTYDAGSVLFLEIDSHLDVFTPEPGAVSVLDDRRNASLIIWHGQSAGHFQGASRIVIGNSQRDPTTSSSMIKSSS
jgi:hypothetical protein